jgi:uncharacterized protein YecT (DUF1311 family)
MGDQIASRRLLLMSVAIIGSMAFFDASGHSEKIQDHPGQTHIELRDACLTPELSTWAKSECFARKYESANRQVEDIYNIILKDPRSRALAKDLADSEQNWGAYMESQCQLEAYSLFGGSATAYTYFECKNSFEQDRYKFLVELKKHVEDHQPSNER